MREYRFTGLNAHRAPVRGTVFAPSKKAATARVTALAEQHQFRVQGVEQRTMFLYKVRHANGEIVKGEQKAYDASEVRAALEGQGLEVLKVEKKLVQLNFKPSTTDVAMFVRLAANMLRRNMPFDEVLTMLSADSGSSALKQVLRDINSDLRSGTDGQKAFMKHQHALGKFTAYMLGLAMNSGNMAGMYEATAKYLERKNEFRKQVRSALITPSITLLAAASAFVWFVWSIIPEMMGLFLEFESVTVPPFTKASLAMADFMDANYWWLLPLIFGSVIGFIVFSRTVKGRYWVHKTMIGLPVLGDLLHKLNLEIFCRVFGVLYAGSGENEKVMRIAAEATGNTYMEHQIKTITVPMMVARGADLVDAMHASRVFLPLTLARFRAGAETGSVQETATEMADFYEQEASLKLGTTVESIKTAAALVISLLVAFLTIVSTESALMMPSGS